MDDPTPRPPVGTDPAPCPDCGAPIRRRAWPVPGTYVHCDACGWEIHTERVVDLTLAGAPWTRALWAEVERLRTEAAELRLELAAEQGRQEGIAREAFILGAKAAHEDTVEGRYNCDPGYDWDCDPRILDDAKDNAEAQAAAKEPTPPADIYDQALTEMMPELMATSGACDISLVQALRPTGPARSELPVRCPICDNRQTLRPLVCEVFECHGHSVTIRCEGGRIVSWTERSPAAKEPTAAEHSGRVWLTGIHGYHLGKFEAVKAIRSVAGLGLREAMTLVESVSTEPLIPLRADRDRAADIAILRAAGCQLRIEEPTP